jgi:UDP-N-acetylglucosamine 1-carboxyvinyltransferase
MDEFRISGGVSLRGSLGVSGAKNSALPIMAACLLSDEPCELRRVPRLTDVATLGRLLESLGLRIRRPGPNRLRLIPGDARTVVARYEFVRRMRASFCVLGPLLARRRRAVVPLPGGCNIGDRPVDCHLRGLTALGADVQLRRGYVVATVRRLQGATIDLSGPRGSTVTGTANVMSAATLARGETVIQNAAVEPEIVDLGQFLMRLGARIEGLGTSTLRILGVDSLGGCTYQIIPDRIEAATLMIAAVMTRGAITLQEVCPAHLTAVSELLTCCGATLSASTDQIDISHGGAVRPFSATAGPFPDVPTDVQAQLTALMTVASGDSQIRDTVFPSRYAHVPELLRLGARIRCEGDTAHVTGVSALEGSRVVARDLRASAALVLAGLTARGTTRVAAIHHLDRGYERLEQKLNLLGARIRRLPMIPPRGSRPDLQLA